jgi:hypothetical protein
MTKSNRPDSAIIDQALPNLPGMTREELERDIAHPRAAEVMPALMAQDGPEAIQQGDPAPDFCLPRLGGPEAGLRVRLSHHFAAGAASRPVALVFGSYT